jgi:hypothetical protein
MGVFLSTEPVENLYARGKGSHDVTIVENSRKRGELYRSEGP